MLTINSLLNGACRAIEERRLHVAKTMLCLALALANRQGNKARIAGILRAISAVNMSLTYGDGRK
jgi:hypothetical protein